jgi:mannose-6-phosphate isomerase-like protein (cupin superfamily)
MSFISGPARTPVVLAPDGGQPVLGPTGQPMIIKAGAADSEGAYSVIEYSHAPGAAGPPPHIHYEHEEAFYVVEGELTLQLGDESVVVGAGGFAMVPRGTVHRPSNTSAEPVRFLFISSPPMEQFFLELEKLLDETDGRPTAAQLLDLGREWDSIFVGLDRDGDVAMHNE